MCICYVEWCYFLENCDYAAKVSGLLVMKCVNALPNLYFQLSISHDISSLFPKFKQKIWKLRFLCLLALQRKLLKITFPVRTPEAGTEIGVMYAY